MNAGFSTAADGCAHGGGIRNQRQDSAENHDHQANPNPRNHGVQMRLNDWAAGVLVLAFIHNV